MYGRRGKVSSGNKKRVKPSHWDRDAATSFSDKIKEGTRFEGDRRLRMKSFKGHNSRRRRERGSSHRGLQGEHYPYPHIKEAYSNSGSPSWHDELYEPNWERREELDLQVDTIRNESFGPGLDRCAVHNGGSQHLSFPEYSESNKEVQNASAPDMFSYPHKDHFPVRPLEVSHGINNSMLYHNKEYSPQRCNEPHWFRRETETQPHTSLRSKGRSDTWTSFDNERHIDYMRKEHEVHSSQFIPEPDNRNLSTIEQTVFYSDSFPQETGHAVHHFNEPSLYNDRCSSVHDFDREKQPSLVEAADAFHPKRHQMPMKHSLDNQSSPPPFNDRRPVHSYEVEHRAKPVPLMSVDPALNGGMTTHFHENQSTSVGVPFHERQQPEPPIQSRLGREVRSSEEHSGEYPFSNSPGFSGCDNVLSRLGPKTNLLNRGNDSKHDSPYQQRFHSDISSAFSRLGPEMRLGETAPEIAHSHFSPEAHHRDPPPSEAYHLVRHREPPAQKFSHLGPEAHHHGDSSESEGTFSSYGLKVHRKPFTQETTFSRLGPEAHDRKFHAPDITFSRLGPEAVPNAHLGPEAHHREPSTTDTSFSHLRVEAVPNAAFTRLSPEDRLSAQNIAFQSDSQSSVSTHMTHDYNSRSQPQQSDLRLQIVSENSPILAGHGDQSGNYDRPDNDASICQHQLFRSPLHAKKSLDQIRSEEQLKSSSLNHPFYDVESVYSEYVESPSSQEKTRMNESSSNMGYNTHESIINQQTVSPRQLRDNILTLAQQFSSVQDPHTTSTGQATPKNRSPRICERLRDRSHSGDNKWDSPDFFPEPKPHHVDFSNLTEVKENPLDNIPNIAKLIVGDEVANHLDPFNAPSNNLLHQLFSACSVLGGYLSKEQRKDSHFPIILDVVSSHFEGFFSGTLKSAHLPANSKILFTKELAHIRDDCGKDIPKWRKKIQQFIALSETFPRRLFDALSRKDSCCSASDASMSPQPLVVDEGKEIESQMFIFDQDFVGYRPTTKQFTNRSLHSPDENKVSEESGAYRSVERYPARGAAEKDIKKEESVIGSISKQLKCGNSSKGSLESVVESSKEHFPKKQVNLGKEESISAVRPSVESKLAGSCSGNVKQKDNIKEDSRLNSSSTSVDFSKRFPVGNLVENNSTNKESMKRTVESPKKHLAKNSNKETLVSTSRQSTKFRRRSPENKKVDSDIGSEFLGQTSNKKQCSEGASLKSHDNSKYNSLDQIRKENRMPVDILNNGDESSTSPYTSSSLNHKEKIKRKRCSSAELASKLSKGFTSSQPDPNGKSELESSMQQERIKRNSPSTRTESPMEDNSKHLTLSLPVTSKIPVNSMEKTVEGLQSLLGIVSSDASKETGDCGSVKYPNTETRDTSVSDKTTLSSQEALTEPVREQVKSPQAVSDVNSKKIDNHIVHQHQSLPQVPVDQPEKRRSLSPGEILSSSSPSPPPPPQSSRRSSGYRSHDHRSSRDGGKSQSRSRSHSSPKRHSGRQYSPRPRSPRRSYSYQSHTKLGRRHAMRGRVNPNRRSHVSPHSQKVGLRGDKRKYARSSSESEDELELLDLRKKAILSMISENSSKKPSSASPPKRAPSQTIREEPRSIAPCSTQDNFETVDMDVCDTCSDPDTQSASEHAEHISIADATTNLSAPPLIIKESPDSTKSEYKNTMDITAAPSLEPEPLDSKALLNENVCDSSVSTQPLSPVGIETESLSEDDVTESAVVQEHSLSFSVKILPGNEKTWSIEPVHILPGDDSDTDNEGAETEIKSSTKPVSDISQFLLQARKASADSSLQKESAAVPPLSSSTAHTVPLSLPTSKKKEYLQLKMKLEMHERKKRLKGKPVDKKLSQLRQVSARAKKNSASLIPRAKAHPTGVPSQLAQNEVALSFLYRALSGHERELQEYQLQHEKMQSELTTLTEQLTDCELTIEESDLKLSALETQLSHLQAQIKTSKIAQTEAHEKKAALQTKVRLVKEKCAEADDKIKQVSSGITQTKASIDQHQALCNSTNSSHTSNIVVTSGETTPATSMKFGSDMQVSEVITEPVSDCDTAASSPLPAIEIEPITDSEFSDSPNCQPLSQSIIPSYEAVSDVEMDATSTNGGTSRASSDQAKCQKLASDLQTLLVSDRAVESSSSTNVQSIVCEPREVDVAGLTASLPTQSSTVRLPSSQAIEDQLESKSQLDSANLRVTAAIDTSAVAVGGNATTSPNQWSDENLIPADMIFCSGTCDLFTLGSDEEPMIVVPVEDLQSQSRLEVVSTCISQPVMVAISERSNLSYLIRTGTGYHSPPVNYEDSNVTQTPGVTSDVATGMASYVGTISAPSNNIVTPSVGTNVTPNPKGSIRSSRTRKQKKPVKITSEHRLMLEQKMMKEVNSASTVCREGPPFDNTSGSASALVNESTTCVSSTQEREYQQKTQAKHIGSHNDTLKAVTDDNFVSTSKQVDIRIASLLQQSFQQTFPKRSLTLHQAQTLLSLRDSFPPTRQLNSTTHLMSNSFTGSVLDTINFFHGQSHFPLSTKAPSKLPIVRKNEDRPRKKSVFTPYSSPLLSFDSYMLNPAYRHNEKLRLGSLTHSNKLDPKQLLCKYEMLGVCKDPKCTAQHVRDSVLSQEEMIANLVSNAPQLANCTPTDLEEAEVAGPEHVVDKLTTYSSSFVKQYSRVISDEEIYTLAAHKVNKARKAANPDHQKHYFVLFSDRNWLSSEQLSDTAATVSNVKTPDLDLLYLTAEDTVDSRELAHSFSDKVRYFTKDHSLKRTQIISNRSDDSVEHILELANSYKQQKKFQEVLKLLEDGLNKFSGSLKLWVALLHTNCLVHHTKTLPEYELSLQEVCSKAFDTTNSYPILLECVQAGKSAMWKEKWIIRGLKCVLSTPSSPVTSHQALELLLNRVLLSVCLGKLSTALGVLETALFGISEKPCAVRSAEFEGLGEYLSLGDRQLVCVCLLHLVYWHQIPSRVFGSPEIAQVPSQIVCKTCSVNWNSKKTLPSQDSEAMRGYIQKFWHLCELDEEISADSVAACLPLLSAMVGFEVAYGSHVKALGELEKLVNKVPTDVGLWLLYSRNAMLSQGFPDSEIIMSRALTVCPHSAQLYYFAARLELHTARGSELDVTECSQRAVDLLEKCIKSFYDSSASSVEPLVLYRKLLGLFVPYDQKLPRLADHVTIRDLRSQHASLWMAYCLLVELTADSSQSAVDAYESAVHSILDHESSIAVWKEYLSHLQSISSNSVENMNLYFSCIRRCLLAVDSHRANLHVGQPDYYEDYTFHNEVIESFLAGVQCTPSQELSFLQSFGALLPNNSNLTTKIVSCALDQETPCFEVAQSLLATHLSKTPYNALLWRLATSIEIKLGHNREARWIFRQATCSLPHCWSIWIDFLVFELNQHIAKASTKGSDLVLVCTVLSRAQQCGVEFLTSN